MVAILAGHQFGNDAKSIVCCRTIESSPAPAQPTASEAGTSPETPTVTASTISLTGLTSPSLWWAKEQFADRDKKFGNQLIETWAAYEGQAGQMGRVDFFVNRQLWTQLGYVERYTFIHEFGTVANGYGYNVRVFNDRQEFLASYTCNAKPTDPSQPAPACDTILDSSGKAGFRSKPTSPLAP